MPRWRFAAVVALLFATAAFADPPAAPPKADAIPRGPSREPDPYTYRPADWKAVPREFLDDAPACVLYAATTVLLDDDGTVETITHDLTRLNGRKAIEQLGEYRRITYDPAYEKLTLHTALVHKPDGRTVEVTAKHTHLRDLGTDFLVYDPGKRLVISFPHLEVGDVIEVKWSTRGKNPEHAGQFFTRYTFGDDHHPVHRDVFTVRLGKDRTFHHAAVGPGSDTLKPETTDDADNRRTYRWAVMNRRELPKDEHLPSKEEFRLQVACSTFADWTAVGRWKQALRADCWASSAEIRKIVADCTRDCKDAAGKARALTYWVRKNIRYVSQGDRHDYTPHPPAQVCTQRFGDCKDTSQLLAVMLREAGVPVALATIGARDDGQVIEAVPSPWGSHALLRVTLDGTVHWIDTTLSWAGWDFLPPDDCDRLAYVTDETGLTLARTPRFTAAHNQTIQETLLTVAPDGTARGVRSLTASGLAALHRREDFIDTPTGERRRLVAGDLQDAHERTRLRALTVDEAALANLDRPVSFQVEYETPDRFSGDSTGREGSLADNAIWQRLLSVTVDYDRTRPLDLGSPFESIHRFTVELPLGFRFANPPRAEVVKSRWGTFTITPRKPAGRRLTLEIATRLDRQRVEPDEFEAFRAFQEELARVYRVYLKAKPTADHDAAEDRAGLRLVAALFPLDLGSAEVLARLELAVGERAAAVALLRRAVTLYPTEKRVWEQLAAASGDAAGSVYREMAARFPEEPKYALELGRMLADAGEVAQARTTLTPLTRKGSASVRADAFLELARIEKAAGDLPLALKHLLAARKTDSNIDGTADFQVLLGQVFVGLDRPKDAAVAFRAALEIGGDPTEALEGLVRLAWLDGDGTEALRYLRRLVAAAENDAEVTARAADWFYKLGRTQEAADLALGAKHGKELLPLANRTLGLVALRRGEAAPALDYLAKAPLDTTALEARLRALVMLGRLADAASLAARPRQDAEESVVLKRAVDRVKALTVRFDALRAVAPDEAPTLPLERFVCGEALWQEGHSANLIEPLLTEAGDYGPALALRGWLAADRGRLDKAAALAEAAMATGAADFRAWLVRGRVRLERGELAALADLEQGVRQSKRSDPTALHWLATALAKAGRPTEALAAQQAAARLRPDDREIAEQLRQLVAREARKE